MVEKASHLEGVCGVLDVLDGPLCVGHAGLLEADGQAAHAGENVHRPQGTDLGISPSAVLPTFLADLFGKHSGSYLNSAGAFCCLFPFVGENNQLTTWDPLDSSYFILFGTGQRSGLNKKIDMKKSKPAKKVQMITTVPWQRLWETGLAKS